MMRCNLKIGTFILASLALAATAADHDQAWQILEASGVKGGLIVHLGCGDGKLTAALRANDSFIVHGLDADVTAARQHIQSLGLYGPVLAEKWAGDWLPYADNLVNLVVADKLGRVPMEEVLRVLAPNGVALIAGKKIVKPRPAQIDEWTHYLHDADNNAVAHDKKVGPPKGLQWFAGPLYCRSHETDSSVSAIVSSRGRIFYVLDEGPIGVADKRLPQKWALIARDAFNGVLLWKVPLPNWGWPEWKKNELSGVDWTTLSGQRLRSPETLPRRLVSDGERVYITLGFNAPVSVLDAVTGKTLHNISGTDYADEILCRKGILLVCIRQDRLQGGGAAKMGRKGKQAAPPPPPATSNRILAVNAGTGEILWQVEAGEVAPLCVATDGQRVYYHNYRELVCLKLATGAVQWRTASNGDHGNLFTGPNTLIVHDSVVLFNGENLEAFSAETGKSLWKTDAKKGPAPANPPDLFVTGGLVWSGLSTSGRDLMTGAVRRTIDLKQLINPWHHYRCYRSKATDQYLIWPKQGAEFIDLEGNDNMRHDWFRGPCKYGILPCNGLVYAGPHQCSCFAGVKLNGFNAFTATSAASTAKPTAESRFEKGPAYESISNLQSPIPNPGDWPTFRADFKRSGMSAVAVPANAAPLWQAKFAGKLSQPVVAGDKLLVAEIDAAKVCCLDAQNGHELWSFTAGGRVDSPPTIYGELALFGSADGWVYCVRVSDGALAWRFRAAPVECRIVAMNQVESVWPVHGTVLVQKGVAYVAAGRSTFLDGGIFFTALDPATGKLIHETHLEGPYPDVATDNGGSRSMQGARSDVLVGNGSEIYLRQVKFDRGLKLQGPWTTQLPGPESDGLRLTSTSDLLDDSAFNRTAWHYSNWDVNQAGAQLLVFNDTTTFGVQVYSKHQAQSMLYFPGQNYVKLFAVKNPNLQGETSPAKGKKKSGKAAGDLWTETVPIYARALALADKTLFVAGPPDTLTAIERQTGGVLWAVAAADGKKLAETKLDAAPVFDGMIVAGGRLFISMTDGSVVCMGKQ